eukprot:5318113-Prymnesium_polylepis.1
MCIRDRSPIYTLALTRWRRWLQPSTFAPLLHCLEQAVAGDGLVSTGWRSETRWRCGKKLAQTAENHRRGASVRREAVPTPSVPQAHVLGLVGEQSHCFCGPLTHHLGLRQYTAAPA